jgi:DNA-binding PadR family transcriptional regulator
MGFAEKFKKKEKGEKLDRKDVGKMIAMARGNRRVPLQTIILGTLAVTGVLATALVAPKVLGLFEYLNPTSRKNTMRFNQRITQALLRLERSGLIHITGEGRKREIHLTQQGEKKVDALYAGAYVIPLPVRWDGKWRVVMFDVSERRKKVRDTLRMLLRSAGFVHFQHSAWIQPYPCDELVTLLRSHLWSGKGEIRYLTASFVDESDYAFRKRFNLDSI